MMPDVEVGAPKLRDKKSNEGERSKSVMQMPKKAQVPSQEAEATGKNPTPQPVITSKGPDHQKMKLTPVELRVLVWMDLTTMRRGCDHLQAA